MKSKEASTNTGMIRCSLPPENVSRLMVVSRVAKENCPHNDYQESFTCTAHCHVTTTKSPLHIQPLLKTEHQSHLSVPLIISLSY